MTEQASGPIGDVIEYVKKELTLDGVEVKGWGTDSVTLRLPYKLEGVNEIISSLDYEFGGQQTFHSTNDGGMLIVAPDPAHKVATSEPPSKRGSNAGALLAGVLVGLVIVLLVAMLTLPSGVVFGTRASGGT